MCACGHGARGVGGLPLSKTGQQSSEVFTALWGQGEFHVSWLASDWAEAGLCCCQWVAFVVMCILHATSMAVGVCLGAHAFPNVFLAVSFPSTRRCKASSLPQRGVLGFLQATGTLSLCSA